ncbi:TlpA disulfide reductase family protein [Aggregicoccus sp. 17bor-14]|uniref:TlpA disulfide reductase family protein n=1 Tax=Myxococcaceae TaxID=31 RepID=UPI003519E31D
MERPERRRRWRRWALDALLVLLAVVAVSAWQTRGLPSSGTRAPGFTLRTLDGGTLSLAQLRGRPVVLTFWAPWCAVCKAETPNLARLQRLAGERAHVVSVAVAYPGEEAVRRFVREQEVQGAVGLGDDALQEAYGVSALPTTLFLGEDGRVRHAAVGYTTTLGLVWRLWL